jgi:SAP domain.
MATYSLENDILELVSRYEDGLQKKQDEIDTLKNLLSSLKEQYACKISLLEAELVQCKCPDGMDAPEKLSPKKEEEKKVTPSPKKQSPSKLMKMTKRELIKMCRDQGLQTYGTKKQLCQRIQDLEDLLE